MGGIDQYTALMLHCDGAGGATTFLDATAKNVVTANGNTNITNNASYVKFGTGSANFIFFTEAPTNYLSVPDTPWFRAQTDYTIDFWVNTSNVASENDLVAKANQSSSFSPYLILISSGLVYFLASSTGSSWDIFSGSFGSISANTWNHIAVCRQGSNYYMFLNGVLGATATSSSAPMQTADPLLIGSRGPGFYGTYGYIDEFRFSSGIARWTSNFTPPVSAYTTEDAGEFGNPYFASFTPALIRRSTIVDY